MDNIYITNGTQCRIGSPTHIYWKRGHKQEVLEAPQVGRILQLTLEGRGLSQLLDTLETADRLAAETTVQMLIHRGILTTTNPGQVGGEASRCSVVALEADLGQAMAAAVAELGVTVDPEGSLSIVVVSDYLDSRLENWHRECVSRQRPWLLVNPTGNTPWIGPVFHAPATACWACLRRRLREKRWLEAQLGEQSWFPQVADKTSPLLSAACLAAQLARRSIEGWRGLENRIWTLDCDSLESRWHSVQRFSDCPDCGAPEPQEYEGPHLQSRIVAVRPHEDPRSSTAESVIDRLEPFESPVTGIAEFMATEDGEHLSLALAKHNVTTRPPGSFIPGAVISPGVCSGRGWTREQARAACLAEAVERYSLQFRDGDKPIVASWRETNGDALHPNAIQLFSSLQFERRHEWNNAHRFEDSVPEPFDEDEKIAWMEGWSLSHGVSRLMPLALCRSNYRPPAGRWIGDAGSNGCASGSVPEEAILEGLLELIERDALAIWWYNQVRSPQVGAEFLSNPYAQAAVQKLVRENWQISLYDLTTDLGVPVFAAVAIDPSGRWVRGSGAHMLADIAAGRAILEMLQLSSSALDQPQPHRGLDIVSNLPARPPAPVSLDLHELLDQARSAVERAGLEVVVFDLTRHEIGFPVFRVVAPGLRPSLPRFAKGRLYDVPVQMRWLPAAKREDELRSFSPHARRS